MTSTIRQHEIRFDSDDGLQLGGSHWRAAEESRGVVVIATATGVHHRFYRRYGEFLAHAGFDAMAFDWRGMGASRTPRGHRDPRLTMRNWGERDLSAAIAWAQREAGGRNVHLVGHSFGGQALGLATNGAVVQRAVFVGAQHGWMGHWPRSAQLPLWLLWRVGMPLSAALLGRFPSRLVGAGETLPRGVALEWARWCSRPEHMGTWDGHAKLRLPILSLSFADDAIAPKRAAEALHERYARATVTHEHQPASGLGHFGFFRGVNTQALWERTRQFLSAT